MKALKLAFGPIMFLLISCQQPKPVASAQTDRQEQRIADLTRQIDSLESVILDLEKSSLISAHDSVLFILKRTPCLGNCPVYNFEVYADGFVKYSGKAYVEHLGNFTGVLNIDQLKKINTLFLSSDFYDFESEYNDGRTDIPASIIEYYGPEGYKRVEARTQIPQKYRVLFNELELVMEQVNWDAVND